MTGGSTIDTWRKIGLLCLMYGVVALSAGLVFSRFFSFGSLVFDDPAMILASEFVIFSALFSIAFFSLRDLRQQEIRDISRSAEMKVAGFAAVGFAVPLIFAGLLLSVFARPQYEGVERWLPEIQNPQTYELQAVQELVAELELSQEVEWRAEEILETLHDRELLRGQDVTAIVSASVYVAAREENMPRTLEEISEITGVEQRDLGKAYRFIGRNTDARIIPPQPEEYLDWFTEKLGLGEDTKQQAYKLLEQAHEKEFVSGKSPKGMASSALYLSAHMEGEHRTMNEVSDVLDVTTVTLRERSRDFVEELGLEDVPDHLLEYGK